MNIKVSVSAGNKKASLFDNSDAFYSLYSK